MCTAPIADDGTIGVKGGGRKQATANQQEVYDRGAHALTSKDNFSDTHFGMPAGYERPSSVDVVRGALGINKPNNLSVYNEIDPDTGRQTVVPQPYQNQAVAPAPLPKQQAPMAPPPPPGQVVQQPPVQPIAVQPSTPQGTTRQATTTTVKSTKTPAKTTTRSAGSSKQKSIGVSTNNQQSSVGLNIPT